MNIGESTAKANQAAESLCIALRSLAKDADRLDPLFGYVVQSQIPKANELKNMLVLIDGALKRRAKA